MGILDCIDSPNDIKKLNITELKTLAKEIRQVILDTVLQNGGHLASSLGAVEIIIAMHYVFDAPYDKLIFDVGHQCYAHKLLTGRYKSFNSLRKMGGLAGFPKRNESVYDTVNTGHSSTSLSVACGITRAMKAENDKHITVSLIGDGALTGGLAYEALNDGVNVSKKQIILLNDNSMSISENVGSTAKYLLKLHTSDFYQNLKNKALFVVDGLKIKDRDKSLKFLYNAKNSVKYFLQGGMPFEQFGLRYFGPLDGHNIEQLIRAFKVAKDDEDSVLLHIVTVKGRGFLEAEKNSAQYHGYSPNGGGGESFSSAFGDAMIKLAEKDDKVYAITAAMREGTGLEKYSELYPERFADVGIAEGHATTMSAGLALSGFKPYFAVYSSFLQRAYDNVIHDVCMQDLPVTFCIDRAGIIPGDGETHQGIYDLNFLKIIPNMTIAAPKSLKELEAVMEWSLTYNHPLAIRYPKGNVNVPDEIKEITLGKWDVISEGKSDIVMLAAGAKMVDEGYSAAKILGNLGIDVTLVNARFIKPMDIEYLSTLKDKFIVTLEDNQLSGGFGSSVLEVMAKLRIKADVVCYGIEDMSLTHASVQELLEMTGLSAVKIAERIKEDYNAIRPISRK